MVASVKVKEVIKVADYMMWVGGTFYPSIQSFCDEAQRLGCCKRIGAVPSDLVINESKIYLIHDEHRAEGKIFGFFVCTSLELIISDPNKIAQYEIWKDEIGITPIPIGVAVLEEERGCGHRVEGGLYVCSDPEQFDKLFEMVKPIADKVDVKGGIVVFKNYLPYKGKRFRGYRKLEDGMIPPLDDLGIAKVTYKTSANAIKVRPFFI